MDFSTIFDTFINWQTAVLCLGIALTMMVVRTLVEIFWVNAKKNIYYAELFLGLGPILLGTIIGAFAHMFPWPVPGISVSLVARCMYGGICGMASGWVYGRFKSWVKATTTTPEETSSENILPPPNQ